LNLKLIAREKPGLTHPETWVVDYYCAIGDVTATPLVGMSAASRSKACELKNSKNGKKRSLPFGQGRGERERFKRGQRRADVRAQYNAIGPLGLEEPSP